jgi:hypothetical protein
MLTAESHAGGPAAALSIGAIVVLALFIPNGLFDDSPRAARLPGAPVRLAGSGNMSPV